MYIATYKKHFDGNREPVPAQIRHSDKKAFNKLVKWLKSVTKRKKAACVLTGKNYYITGVTIK